MSPRGSRQIVERGYSAVPQLPEAAKIDDGLYQQLDDVSVSLLIAFFKVLDRWDREARGNAEVL